MRSLRVWRITTTAALVFVGVMLAVTLCSAPSRLELVASGKRIDGHLGCVEYLIAGDKSETCHYVEVTPFRVAVAFSGERNYYACYDRVEVGERLPDCWRR